MNESEDDFFYRPQRAKGQRLDPEIRRIALVAGGVSGLVIIVALLWSGVRATGFGPPPVITPPDTPLRVAPSSPGGLVVPGADVPIMSGQTNNNGPVQLAPMPPAPALAQLNQDAGLNPQPPAPPAPPVAASTPASAPPAPAAVQAPSVPQPPAPPVAAANPAPAGRVSVQLAATSTEPGAESTWTALVAKFPSLLAGRNPDIVAATVNGQDIWRLRLPGFANQAAAQAFCAKLTSQGVACTVAAF